MNHTNLAAFFIYFTCLSCISHGQPNTESELAEFNDLSYGPDSLQELNLVIPASGEPAPLLIWIGGGAWSFVDKDVEMDLVLRVAQRGIAVASVGHRLSAATWRDPNQTEGVVHPAHVQDIALSTRWLIDHAEEYGFDPSKIFIGGFSSGAHLAMLISLDEEYLSPYELNPTLFSGVIPISGAYDMVNYRKVLAESDNPELASLHVDAVFGKSPEALIDASPISYLDHLSQPLLIISDNTVYSYTKLFEDHLRETTFRDVQVSYAYNLSHGELWRDMSNNPASTYRIMMEDFILKISESN